MGNEIEDIVHRVKKEGSCLQDVVNPLDNESTLVIIAPRDIYLLSCKIKTPFFQYFTKRIKEVAAIKRQPYFTVSLDELSQYQSNSHRFPKFNINLLLFNEYSNTFKLTYVYFFL